MLTWLEKLDPNVVAPAVIALVVAIYHMVFSAAAQQKITAAVAQAVALADRGLDAIIAVAPAGTTRAQLEAQLLAFAKTQLAHAGLDPAKLPPEVTALVQAIVTQAVARWQAAAPLAPVPAPVPVPAPPASPAPPAGHGGFARLTLIVVLSTISLGGMVTALSCAQVQKMTGAFATCAKTDFNQAIDPSKDPALAGLTAADLLSFVTEIVTLNAPALEAQLAAVATIAGLDAVDCAMAAIEAVEAAPQGSGSGSAAPATKTTAKAAGVARARAWVNARRAGGGK